MSTTQATPAEGGERLDEGVKLVIPGKGLSAGQGWDWIAQGWRIFAKSPLMWIISLVILFVIAIVAAFVPLIGSLAFQALQAVFAGGFVLACRTIERGGEFELEHLFAGFSKRFVPLLIVGLVFMAAGLALVLLFFLVAGVSLLPAFLAGDSDALGAALAGSAMLMMVGGLVMLALMVPIMAAYWFAPALVMMHDMAPIEAMKASFFACLRNFVPFLIYSVVMTIALFVAILPVFLGLLVWVPVAIASTYAAYRQIFTEDAVVAAPPRPTMAN